MKKIILLGDSIRLIGYGKKVGEYLGEEYSVWQPKENCRFAQNTLRMIFDMRAEFEDVDTVHWNNGIWDASDIFFDGKPFSSLESYTETILRIADVLKGRAKHIIFATTTPVKEGSIHDRNDWICEFNAHIVPLLEEKGIIINDLHSLVLPHVEDYICEDKVHLSELGTDACAKAVAEKIKEVSSNL